jgi:zinc protease
MNTRIGWRVACSVLALGAASIAPAAPALAQGAPTASSFDRSVIPPAGETPVLHVPAWTQTTLSNGARLIVSERHNLPLVSFSITWSGGSDQYEPADRPGLASLTASMLSEGTSHRTGDQLSNDLQLLGTSVSTRITGEQGSMSFLSLTANFEPTLAILEDMLVNPTFPADALERLRARTLVALAQARDRTSSIAGRVFPKVLYTEAHPYGRSMTDAAVKATTRADIVAFHKAYFTPGHALITVVGDVDAARVRATLERVLQPWPAAGVEPSFDYPPTPAPRATTIYLVDKPGATQSSFAIGLPGPPRSTPDYFALEVLNTILGDQFQSRLNADIREQKGYSYGVGSGFAYGKGPGPFEAGGDIAAAKSDSALIEFMKQLRGVRGSIPITDEELQTAQDLLVQGLPARFASVGSVNGSITSLYTSDLPQDYYQRFAEQVRAVTHADLQRVAERYIDVDHLAIVIVGDRQTIEEPLRRTGVGPIVTLDLEGDPAN